MNSSPVARLAIWVLAGLNALALLNLLSLLVLWLPFRSGERWAWAASWIPVGAFALVLPIMGAEGIGVMYAGVAAVMAVALLATWRDFA